MPPAMTDIYNYFLDP